MSRPRDTGRVQLAVIVPTYNEAANVQRLLRQLAAIAQKHPALALMIFIVDDSSPDGTAQIAQKAAKELFASGLRVKVLKRAAKEGLGAAYRYGFRHVLRNYPQAKYILQMDADLSHNPRYLPQFIDLAEDKSLDLVIGSRYINGGAAPDWSPSRRLLSRGGNLYARLWLGKHITDYTGGFNLYSMAVIKRLQLDDICSDGYSFQIEMKHRTSQLTPRVAELPIIFKDRSRGVSKIPRDTIYRALILVPRLRLAGTSGRNYRAVAIKKRP